MVRRKPVHFFAVAVGPETPMIDGPDLAETGQYAVFTCSAMSMPTSQFSWWFNGSYVANSSVFTTDILSLNMSGDITCMAYNDVTGKNATTSKLFTVIGKNIDGFDSFNACRVTLQPITYRCVFCPQKQKGQ